MADYPRLRDKEVKRIIIAVSNDFKDLVIDETKLSLKRKIVNRDCLGLSETMQLLMKWREKMKPEQPMTLKDWIITMILLFIPIVGLVMLIIWAIDKEDPRNIFSKAYLIVSAGVFAITFIIYLIIFVLFFSFAI